MSHDNPDCKSGEACQEGIDRTGIQQDRNLLSRMGRSKASADNHAASYSINGHRIFGPARQKIDHQRWY
jgi:hypothetical protein